MISIVRNFSLIRLVPALRDMILLAALRGSVAVLALVGKELALTEAERQAVLARVQASLRTAEG